MSGHQTRSAAARADLVELGRELLQVVHEQPLGALQHRSRPSGLKRQSDHPAAVLELEHGTDIQDVC